MSGVRNGSGDKTFKVASVDRLSAGGTPISAPGRNSGPVVTDWDGDGRDDLLVGCGDGSVQFGAGALLDRLPVEALDGIHLMVALLITTLACLWWMAPWYRPVLRLKEAELALLLAAIHCRSPYRPHNNQTVQMRERCSPLFCSRRPLFASDVPVTNPLIFANNW